MDVKKLRETLGITQQELADKCGVTLRTVQNWEVGKIIPKSMEKLLNVISENHEIVSSFNTKDSSVKVSAGDGSPVTINPETERFFSTLERQQDIMSRQLEEMAQMLKLSARKDEQIDLLLKMIIKNDEHA